MKKKTKKIVPKKKVKKEPRKKVIKKVEQINRGKLKEKTRTKYEVTYNFIKEHSGEFTRKEIIEQLEKPPYSIPSGTSSTTFCQFMNKKYGLVGQNWK